MQRLSVAVLAAVMGAVLLGAGQAEATWSIVGVDQETGEVGVAVASCVGFEVTIVPVLVPGIGAAASQADISRASGRRLVDALESGASAQEVIDAVVAADDGPDDRQFGAVVIDGSGAGWTGADNLVVATDRRNADATVSAQGNILTAEDVVVDAIAAFDAADGELADRLLAGLRAGGDAGGDSRCGEQTATAAALLVATPDDAVYAHTDAGLVGVDPDATPVPSVFVSVLVNRDGDRAPDRLAEVWESADRNAPTIVIRQIDDGADTEARRLEVIATVILVVAGLLVVGAVVAVVVFWRRRRAAESTHDPDASDPAVPSG
jgi:uncharacterized Ntn-hydrolase superfamily protein